MAMIQNSNQYYLVSILLHQTYNILNRTMDSPIFQKFEPFDMNSNEQMFERQLQEQFRKAPLFQCDDIDGFVAPLKQRVSEKLLENRLKRLQLNIKKQQQIQELLQKRQIKQKEIRQAIKNRLDTANRKKQENLRQNNSQQQNRRKQEQTKSLEKLRRFESNMQKIEKGRQKAEQKRNQYIFRIHKKGEQQLRKAFQKKQHQQSIEEQQNDEIHLDQWNRYKEKIMKKYKGQPRSSADRLYQQFRQKNVHINSIINQKIPQVEDYRYSKQINTLRIKDSTFRIQNSQSAKCLATEKKPTYFGIHEDDMMKKTLQNIYQLRSFLTNEGVKDDEEPNEQVTSKFKQLLLQKIIIQ